MAIAMSINHPTRRQAHQLIRAAWILNDMVLDSIKRNTGNILVDVAVEQRVNPDWALIVEPSPARVGSEAMGRHLSESLVL